MNRTEVLAVVVLFGFLVFWGLDQSKRVPPQDAPQSGQVQPQGTSTGAVDVAKQPPVAPVPWTPPAGTGAVHVATMDTSAGDEGHSGTAPDIRVLSNDVAEVHVSSWGGAVTAVRLYDYRVAEEKDSERVMLDFAEAPALSLKGIPGLSTNNDFTVSPGAGMSIRIEKVATNGIRFERTISLGEGYLLSVQDQFKNERDTVVKMPTYAVAMGPMKITTNGAHKAFSRGAILGVDARDSGSGKIVHWAERRPMKGHVGLAELFQQPARQGGGGCLRRRARMTQPLWYDVHESKSLPADWLACKNKFFVQILSHGEGTAGFILNAERKVAETETQDPNTWADAPELVSVSADLQFPEKAFDPGETLTREMTYYVGPKKHSFLKPLPNQQSEVMEFGALWWLVVPLLTFLNAINSVLHNYGVAIILLTAVVRIVFWPVTHKSTQSMKKMSAIQPLVKALREKYKSNPQKMNREVMALYKEHGVSPMGGCLPMLIQIPVFIALFTMLRSAVELRFADFLWIRDLSEPERLIEFGVTIPLIGWDALNPLPIVMTVTMLLQQKLTPSSGDPQQKRMMYIMSAMMLFLFYNMASALVLYWTTSQAFQIGQLLWQRRRDAAAEAAKA